MKGLGAAAAHEVAILPGAEVTQHAAVLGQPQQGHRHGVNGDGAEGDVEEGAHEEHPPIARLRTSRGRRRSSNQALPRPMTAPVAAAASSRARCVGTRRTIQCTSSAAATQPHVIQSAVRAVYRVRREITGGTNASLEAGRTQRQ